MKSWIFAGLASVVATASAAADLGQSESIFLDDVPPVEQFLWTKRPVIVFADTPNDPRYIEQVERLQARQETLAERDVVILTDTDPEARSDLRQKLRPRGFMLVLIGKDGEVKLRKPAPWDVREISRTIDKMPMRQQEVRERRAAEG
ncbi:MAG: DUF4174 domain-containing protein [Pseudomonadota bacterium]